MSKEFYHWLAVSGNEAQRLGYSLIERNPAGLFVKVLG